MLMIKILNYYHNLGSKEIVIYNYHHSSSNSFYRKFGATVFKTVFQMSEKISTDVFKCDIATMLASMDRSLSKYNKK